jgi:hypothetical protein
MRRDFKRKRKSARFKSGTDKKVWRRLFAIVFVLTVVSIGGFYLWKNRASKMDTSAVTASFHKFSEWVAEHKHRLNQKIVKVKQLADSKQEEPIHFEFYSELPNTTVPVPPSESSENKS